MNIRFRNIALVARREIRTIVATKGFLLMIFVPLLLLFLMISLIPLVEKLMNHPEEGRTKSAQIGVIGSDPAMLEAWRSALADRKLSNGLPFFDLESISLMGVPQETIEANAEQNVRDKELDAYIVLRGDITDKGYCDLYSMREFEEQLPFDLMRGLGDVVRQKRLRGEGLEPGHINYLTRDISWNNFEVPAEQRAEGGPKRKRSFEEMVVPASICVMMMFWLTIMTSQMLLRGIVEEKNSRLVEVLLSSLSPTEIMSGKVLAFYIIGLIEFAAWVGIGIMIVKAKGFVVSDIIPPVYFLKFLIFLTPGYLFFAALFSAVGAIVGNEAESQQIQPLIIIPCVLPMMFLFVFVTQPNWWLVRLASFIPVFTPAAMAARMVSIPIPWWEIMLVASSTVVFSILAIWIAARIFRVGILLTGKRPALREVWRWCWYRDVSGVLEI